MPLSSSMNRRRDALTFLSQQQSQEDVTRELKASIKLLPARNSREMAYDVQRDEECSFDQAENREGDDSEEWAREPFRTQRVWLDEDDERSGLWTLKRANPVFDENETDEEDESQRYESPPKRSRAQTLSWSDQVSGTIRGFDFEFSTRAP
jgi:hypothetical protein